MPNRQKPPILTMQVKQNRETMPRHQHQHVNQVGALRARGAP